ncbi:MAG: M1 family peptidase, partial [Sphingobacteriales bacterium]
MSWFFNQWYFGAGHPVLNITYKWNDATKTQTVYMNQTQDGNAFILPIAIDVYAGGKMERKKFWIRNKVDSLVFHSAVKPSLVNVDGDKMLLVKKTDSKTLDEFVFQYFNAPLYLDRFEAITAAVKQQSNAGARKVVIAALNDKYYELQIKAIRGADMSNDDVRNAAQPILTKLAQTDPNTLVRAAAISVLGKLKASGNTNLFKDALKSQSYAVQGAALTALGLLNPADAVSLAKTYEKDSEGALTQAILNVYATGGSDAEYDYVYNSFKEGQPQTQFGIMKKFADFTGRIKSNEQALKGTNAMIDFGMKYKKYGVAPQVVGILAEVKANRAKLNDTATVAAID